MKKYKLIFLSLLLFSLTWAVICLPVTNAKYIYFESHHFIVNTQNFPKQEFEFIDNMVQTSTMDQKEGLYIIQAWGADGGDACLPEDTSNNSSSCEQTGGSGGYIVGQVYLNSDFKFIINVGGRGGDANKFAIDSGDNSDNGGYNGGGSGSSITNNLGNGGGGGGSTEISLERFGYILKDPRMVVAGGGGGGAINNNTFLTGGFGGRINLLGELSNYDDTFDNAFTSGATIPGMGYIKDNLNQVYGVAGQMESETISSGGEIDSGSLKQGEAAGNNVGSGGGGSGYYGGHATNGKSGGGGSSILRLGVYPLEEKYVNAFSHERPEESRSSGNGYVIITYVGK